MKRLLKEMKRILIKTKIKRKVDTKEENLPINNDINNNEIIDLSENDTIKDDISDINKNETLEGDGDFKNQISENKNLTRYGFGAEQKRLTVQEIEVINKSINEQHRQEFIDKIFEFRNSINPYTGKRYTYREIALELNCSRTTVGDILNNKTNGSNGKTIAKKLNRI